MRARKGSRGLTDPVALSLFRVCIGLLVVWDLLSRSGTLIDEGTMQQCQSDRAPIQSAQRHYGPSPTGVLDPTVVAQYWGVGTSPLSREMLLWDGKTAPYVFSVGIWSGLSMAMLASMTFVAKLPQLCDSEAKHMRRLSTLQCKIAMYILLCVSSSLCWASVAAINDRNPLINHYGDRYLRLMLFWNTVLSAAEMLELLELMPVPAKRLAQTLLVWQVASVYIGASHAKLAGGEALSWGLPVLGGSRKFGVDKHMPMMSWGDAIPRALVLSSYKHPASNQSVFHLCSCMVQMLPQWALRAISPCVVALEFASGIILFAVPIASFYTDYFDVEETVNLRSLIANSILATMPLVLASLAIMHASFACALRIGTTFAFIFPVGLLAAIPQILTSDNMRWHKRSMTNASHVVVIALLACTFTDLSPVSFLMCQCLKGLQLEVNWGMFSPSPPAWDRTLVVTTAVLESPYDLKNNRQLNETSSELLYVEMWKGGSPCISERDLALAENLWQVGNWLNIAEAEEAHSDEQEERWWGDGSFRNGAALATSIMSSFAHSYCSRWQVVNGVPATQTVGVDVEFLSRYVVAGNAAMIEDHHSGRHTDVRWSYVCQF